MANYGVNYSPVFTPMTDKTKGSKENRKQCVKEMNHNNLKTTVLGGTIGGVAGLAIAEPQLVDKAVANASVYAGKAKSAVTPYLQKLANTSIGQKAASLFAKAKGSSFAQKAMNFINTEIADLKPTLKELGSNAIKVAKAHPVLAGLAVTSIAVLALNSAFKNGQIDQKYTDKAKYENA